MLNLKADFSPKIISERNFHLVEESIMILLIVLSLVGIGVMDFSPSEGYWYCGAMTVIFGLAALVISFVQGKQGKNAVRKIWLEQSLLWFGVLLALCGKLLILYSGVLDDQNAGLVILLILSLAIYIDGLRIGWRFALVGNFLGLTAVAIAFLENFMWILYGLAALTIGFTIYWEKRQVTK